MAGHCPAAPPPTITPEWLSARIGEAVGPEAIIVNEYPLRLAHCRRSEPGTYFGLSAAGGLGWGFGAALGAKLAQRDRLVAATLGDGAYMFANPTAAHWIAQGEDLPVLTVVFNNRGWKSPKLSALAVHPSGYASRANTLDVAFDPPPDYAAIATAAGGAWGRSVRRPEEVESAIAEALRVVHEERRCAVLDVWVPHL